MLKNNKSSRASEERYRKLFEHMSSGVAVYEATENGEDFILIDFNSAAEKIDGIRKDELIGKKVTEVFPGVIEFGLFEVFRRVWQTGVPEKHPVSQYQDGRISGWRENYVYKLPSKEIVAIYDDVTPIKQAEEALQAQKLQLETIIKASKTGLWDWDLRTDEVYFSPEWKQQIGYEDHEISNNFSEWKSRVHPDDLEKAISNVQEFIKNPYPDYENEFRFQHKDGTYIWILTKGSLIEDEKGNPIRMLGSHLDITKRKQVEEELSQIFTMSLDMICIADINTATFIKVNPSFTEVLGYSEEELLNKPFVDFIHLDDIDSTFAVIEQRLQSGSKVINFENRYRCKDGTYRWLSWVSHPDANKGVTYAIARDITEKKEYEKSVAESQALLEATSRMANVGGWELDLNTQKVLWTHMTGKIHELPEGLQPPLEEAINFYHPDDREMVAEYVNQAVEEGIPYEFEARLITYKGRQRWVRAIGKPTMEGGKCVKLSGTFQDITERKQAEEQVKQQQYYLEKAQELGRIGTWQLDILQNKIFWTDENCRIFGVEPGSVVNYEIFIEKVHPADREYVNREWKLALEGKDYDIEHRLLINDKTSWVREKADIKFNTEGLAVSAIGITQDITERKQTEENLQKKNADLQSSEKKFKAISDSSPLAIYMSEGIEQKAVYINPTFTKLFGYTIDEVPTVDHWWPKAYPDANYRQKIADEWQEKVKLAIETKSSIEPMEVIVTCKDGSEKNILWDFITLEEQNWACGLDLTERKQAEAALQKAHYELGERVKELNCLYGISKLVEKADSLQSILQGTADLILSSWQYSEVTCAQIKLDGRSYKTDNFKKTEWLQTEEVMVLGKKAGSIEVCYLEEKPEIDEGPFLREERNLINVIAERLGHIIERRQAEAEKEKLEEQLIQSHKMEAVGTMAGGIAHDFNNILTIISGNAELAIDDIPAGNPARESIEEIGRASSRAKDLVSQILAFSRKEIKELIPINPQTLIKETLKLLRSTTPTTVTIIQSISQDCGRIMADPTGLHQILMNLFTNAVHSMDEKGEVTVSLQKVTLESNDFRQLTATTQFFSIKTPGTYARLSVTDTGVGMDEETVERIFDPFYTTKEVGKGTGMGLSVVHGIVESHDGFIDVDSEPGRGSTFSVYLPVTEAEEVEFVEAVTKSSQTGTERILFVDDEEALLVLGKRILDKLGYEVTAENSSVKALEIFKSAPHQFDLIITDQAMPDMSGTELVAELVKIRPDMPVILCTGFSSKVSKENAEELGISKFITKPYTKKIMTEAVREALDGEL